MGLKRFFAGPTARKFWLNIVAMVIVIVAVPVGTLYLLDMFTHHGEKVEVPSLMGKSFVLAESMLDDRGLVAMVTDSAYDKHVSPGAVLAQSPKPGCEVKSGRVVYLTLNMHGVPKVEVPDVVGRGTLRETVALLESMGFKLTPHERVMGQPNDLVLGLKQSGHKLYAGEMVPRDRMMTIIVGGGEIDTTAVDELDDEELPPDIDIEF